MVVADLFEHETASFWKRPGRRSASHPDRGVRAPGLVGRGEGRQHRQQRPLGAVALPRDEAHRRQPPRPRHRRRARAGAQAGVREGRRVPGADPESRLGLRHEQPRGRSASRREGDERTVPRGGDGARRHEGSPRARRCPASPSCATTAPRCRATGSTAAATPRRATSPRVATRRDAPNNIGLHPNWAWVWPMNRRILYNRASVNRKGEPFNPRSGSSAGTRRTSSGRATSPTARMPPGEMKPFIMLASGVGQLFSPDLVGRAVPRALRARREPVQNPLSKPAVEPVRAVWGRRSSTGTAPRRSSRSSGRPTACPSTGRPAP